MQAGHSVVIIPCHFLQTVLPAQAERLALMRNQAGSGPVHPLAVQLVGKQQNVVDSIHHIAAAAACQYVLGR